MFTEAGKRISFHGFGRSNYGSKEMGEALRTIEKAMLVHLVYPVTDTRLPVRPDKKRSPRLQLLDTGLMNYFAGIQSEMLGAANLSDVYKGIVAEHIVGQELLSVKSNVLAQLAFWVREKLQSEAEVDYIITHKGRVIPIEVKSGATGRLRSLHAFMDRSDQDIAVRYYAGELRVETIKTLNNKSYRLLNIPYFLASQTEGYLDWATAEG
jgi:uncharacterized protein